MQRDLVTQAKDGDHDAFATLARGSGDRLFRLANLILGDPELAQDAIQEALILAWRDIRALREPDAWDAWVNRLTVRTCYRLARRERRRMTVDLAVVEEADLAAEQRPGILDQDEVERGFRALATDQRVVLVLHFYLGMRLQEAAEIIGIPIGTAKSRLHRGLLAMRAALDDRPVVAGVPERSL
jgi:RNA polymerase sigma-70 factor (ECF subfamily)